MINKKAVRKRTNTALDSYINYAKHISKHSDMIKIERKETYWIHLGKTTCTCIDFARHGHETICKHIVMAFLWNNSRNHDNG